MAENIYYESVSNILAGNYTPIDNTLPGEIIPVSSIIFGNNEPDTPVDDTSTEDGTTGDISTDDTPTYDTPINDTPINDTVIDGEVKTDTTFYDIIWEDLDESMYNNHFTNGQCYMKVEFNRSDGSSNEQISLPVYPEDISFGASTNYATADILGRPGPISGYVNTSDVTTKISLHLHRELTIPGMISSDTNQIDKIIALMQACSYPKLFSDSLYVPIVTYVFGDTQITGKQTSFTTKWSGPKIKNAYMEVFVEISISHVPKGIIDFDDVKNFNPRQFV